MAKNKKEITTHIQWNGSAWVAQTPKNPNLKCSTDDCSECEKASEKIQALEDLKSKEEKEKAAAEVKEKVDAEAKEQLETQRKEEINKAALLKSQSERKSYLAWLEAQTVAAEAAAKMKAKAQDDFDKKNAEIGAMLDKSLGEADARREGEKKVIAAKDWLAEAKKEEK